MNRISISAAISPWLNSDNFYASECIIRSTNLVQINFSVNASQFSFLIMTPFVVCIMKIQYTEASFFKSIFKDTGKQTDGRPMLNIYLNAKCFWVNVVVRNELVSSIELPSGYPFGRLQNPLVSCIGVLPLPNMRTEGTEVDREHVENIRGKYNLSRTKRGRIADLRTAWYELVSRGRPHPSSSEFYLFHPHLRHRHLEAPPKGSYTGRLPPIEFRCFSNRSSLPDWVEQVR